MQLDVFGSYQKNRQEFRRQVKIIWDSEANKESAETLSTSKITQGDLKDKSEVGKASLILK